MSLNTIQRLFLCKCIGLTPRHAGRIDHNFVNMAIFGPEGLSVCIGKLRCRDDIDVFDIHF